LTESVPNSLILRSSIAGGAPLTTATLSSTSEYGPQPSLPKAEALTLIYAPSGRLNGGPVKVSIGMLQDI
jgi:hypothetical protein